MNGNHQEDSEGTVVGRVTNPSYEELQEARITAYALGQLDAVEKAAAEAELAASETARRTVQDIQTLAQQVRETSRGMVFPPSPVLRAAVESRLSQATLPMVAYPANVLDVPPLPAMPARRSWRTWAAVATAACLLLGAVGLYFGRRDRATETGPGQLDRDYVAGPSLVEKSPRESRLPAAAGRVAAKSPPLNIAENSGGLRPHVTLPEPPSAVAHQGTAPVLEKPGPTGVASSTAPPVAAASAAREPTAGQLTTVAPNAASPDQAAPGSLTPGIVRSVQRRAKHMPARDPGFLGLGGAAGPAYISVPPEMAPRSPAEKPKETRSSALPGGPGKFGAGIGASGTDGDGSPRAGSDSKGTAIPRPGNGSKHFPPSESYLGLPPGMRPDRVKSPDVKTGKKGKGPPPAGPDLDVPDESVPADMVENDFLPAAKFPYSAFSLEVDTSSYPDVERYLRAGIWPPAHRVQIEDLVNSFRYDDPQPKGDVPFFIRVEAAGCPWARDHRLLRIAVVARGASATGTERSRAGQAPSAPPPVADDVRVQLEFNPALVASYRLIGYDGPPVVVVGHKADARLSTGLSFAAGQTVTALYEVIPAKPSKPAEGEARPAKSPRTPARDPIAVDRSTELLTVRLLYRRPRSEEYRLLAAALTDSGRSFDAASPDFQFAAAVAAFGMAFRGSQYRGDISLEAIQRIADSARGEDPGGLRTGFVDLVRIARQLGAGR
jgi:hypothetical protein